MQYTTYVFKCLEKDVTYETRYIMCTRFPNWETPTVEIGDSGYLLFREVEAGIDSWYNGQNMIPYRYSGIHFINFVPKQEKIKKEYIM